MGRTLQEYRRDLGSGNMLKGLGPEDRAIMTELLRFELSRGWQYYSCVPVGACAVEGYEGSGVGSRRQLEQMYCKIIDVVIYTGWEWWVCEVKPSASYVALGQVLTYRWLAARKFEELVRARAVVLTDVVDPDVNDLFGSQGVLVIEAGEIMEAVGGEAEGSSVE